MAGSAKDQKQGWPFIPPGSFFLHHSPTPLGNYLRRMKAKLGPKAATMATAHKIALIFYTMASMIRVCSTTGFCLGSRAL